MSTLEHALTHFKKVDPLLYKRAQTVKEKLRTRLTGTRGNDRLFEKLAEAVVSQQLATKAADSIWKKLEALLGGTVTPEKVQKATHARLRKAGLSNAKAKTLKELAKALQNGLHLPALRTLDREEAEATLTRIWGIGPWTSEMFLMFALAHPDIFSSRDLGLMRSMETLYGLPKNSKREILEKFAEKWSPHRTYACLILWKLRDND